MMLWRSSTDRMSNYLCATPCLHGFAHPTFVALTARTMGTCGLVVAPIYVMCRGGVFYKCQDPPGRRPCLMRGEDQYGHVRA